jgi:hypothetical protein
MDANATIAQFVKMLDNLDRWLVAGVAYAEQRKFPPDVLAQSRLAPDQYELVRQVQSACDQAKYAGAYFSGQEAPSHPDTETTIEECRKRIATCKAYLASIPVASFAGGLERRVSPAWMQGKWIRGDDYQTQVAIPNFFFHVTTAYAILRHNGVPLGKMDYVGALSMND